jgi:superfamily II DNA helicase RecQ
VEEGAENSGGFNSDYVRLAENANAIESGQRQFWVNFPKPKSVEKVAAEAEKENMKSAKKKAKVDKTKSVPSSSKAAAPSSRIEKRDTTDSFSITSRTEPDTVCIDETSSDDSDDDVIELLSTRSRRSSIGIKANSILPNEATQGLISRIKTLATNWAEEERMCGNNMFYWNILSNDVMKTIAAEVPMTMSALTAIGCLGENILKVYGERIVKIVSSYVTQEGLEHYVKHRDESQAPPKKKSKVDSSTNAIKVVDLNIDNDDDDDEDDDAEFGIDVDLSKIESPSEEVAVMSARPKSKAGKGSRYFE